MDALNKFIRIRNQNRIDYIDEMMKYDRDKGTKYYTDRQKEARTKRETADAEARRECAATCERLLQDMQKAADSRTEKPLTADQQNIISSLRGKHRVSRTEVSEAAEAMKGNIVGLRQIQDIERERARREIVSERKVVHNYLRLADPELTERGVSRCMDSLKATVKDVLQSAVTRSGQVSMKYYSAHNGASADPDDYPQKKPFDGERDLYGEHYDVFGKAVNGGIEE